MNQNQIIFFSDTCDSFKTNILNNIYIIYSAVHIYLLNHNPNILIE